MNRDIDRENLLKMLHIDLTDTSIIDNGFNIMQQDIEELDKVLELKK